MSKDSIKQLLSDIIEILPLKALMPSNRQRFLFPFWHAVSDNPPAHLSALYEMPGSKAFANDLDFFLKNYQAASVAQVDEFAKNTMDKKLNLFFPSFDDGLSECYHTIAPILKKKGIQAAFFINPEFVDNHQLFHRHKASLILNFLKKDEASKSKANAAQRILAQTFPDKKLSHFLKQADYTHHSILDQLAAVCELDFGQYLNQHKPYLSLSQIQELQNDGFLIGAHSLDHREFYQASENEILEQISESVDFVVRQIRPEKKWFAFPFTDSKVPDSVFEKAIQENLWDLSFGTAGMKDETVINHIQRIPMESGNMKCAEKVIRAEYAWYAIKSLTGKNKVNRQ